MQHGVHCLRGTQCNPGEPSAVYLPSLSVQESLVNHADCDRHQGRRPRVVARRADIVVGDFRNPYQSLYSVVKGFRVNVDEVNKARRRSDHSASAYSFASVYSFGAVFARSRYCRRPRHAFPNEADTKSNFRLVICRHVPTEEYTSYILICSTPLPLSPS